MQDEHFLVGITHDNDRYNGGFWGPISFTVKGGVFTNFLALIFQGQKLLLLKGAGTFHSAGQSKEDNLVLALPSIQFS